MGVVTISAMSLCGFVCVYGFVCVGEWVVFINYVRVSEIALELVMKGVYLIVTNLPASCVLCQMYNPVCGVRPQTQPIAATHSRIMCVQCSECSVCSQHPLKSRSSVLVYVWHVYGQRERVREANLQLERCTQQQQPPQQHTNTTSESVQNFH